MRALRDPDALPSGDLVLRRALRELGGEDAPGALERISQRWRPYRAYAAMHLWAHPATRRNHGRTGGPPRQATARGRMRRASSSASSGEAKLSVAR